MPKIALAMIVKGADSEAELLSRCLESVSEHVDGIFITATYKKSTEEADTVLAIADSYDAETSYFKWIDDFAAARNFNFSQVPKDFDYVLWTDADDIWRGLENLKDTLEEYKHMDGFGFNYLYDWDEFKNPTVVHRKTMLIKNDGCATWVGALHEDLIENRRMDVQMIEGIERLHLTSGDRVVENAKRNVAIAEKQVEVSPDDPRTYWNLGNSQFGISDFASAKFSFETFLAESESDDEKYLAHARLADVYKALGDRSESVKQLQLAIGLRPSLPDAYLQLAYLYHAYGNLEKAEEYCIQGLLRRPQPDMMIVYNPRDYDYNPMMLLARIYYEKNRPDLMLPLLEGCLKIYPEDKKLQKLVAEGKFEKDALGKALEQVQELEKIEDKEELRKAFDALPEDIKSHPAVCVIRNRHFVKEESTGRDLVIYCGNTNHQWNPELFKTKGFGGSEEAVVHLAREWAMLGWNVTVYNNCGHKPVTDLHMHVQDGKVVQGHLIYRPFWEWNYRDKQDVTILWRWTKPLDAEINSTKIFVDLHDVVPDGEFTEKRLAKVDKVFVKTKFHRSLFPSIPDEKIAVIPNGLETYEDASIVKDPTLVINTSSPDRSMDVLPALWKRVKAEVPDAKLHWAYGWDVYASAHADDPKKMAWMQETIAAMDDAGIEQLGKLPQAEVAKLYQKASFLAYPTEFAEIDCISVKKAQAVKTAVVSTDFGALAESVRYGVKIPSIKNGTNWNKPYQFHFGLERGSAQDAWVEYMVLFLKGAKVSWKGLDEWKAQYAWPTIAMRWNEIISK